VFRRPWLSVTFAVAVPIAACDDLRPEPQPDRITAPTSRVETQAPTGTLPQTVRQLAAARGIVPEACSAWFLPRFVGISTALEWCYSGRVFRAEEGLERGLFRSVHAPEALMPAALALAREFADNTSSVSKALVRHMMWRMLGAEHPIRAHEIDTAGIAATGKSNDSREGIGAFW
jgi:enoyl-CoA hydratase/carnithine racemase